MSVRLGSWQSDILRRAQSQPGIAVSYSSVQPRGTAKQYAGKYQASFRSIAQVPGVQVGALGPHGGLALVYQAVS